MPKVILKLYVVKRLTLRIAGVLAIFTLRVAGGFEHLIPCIYSKE